MIKLYSMTDLSYPAGEDDLVDDQGKIKVCVATEVEIKEALEVAIKYDWGQEIDSYKRWLDALKEQEIFCGKADDGIWDIIIQGDDLTEEMVLKSIQFLNENHGSELEKKFKYMINEVPDFVENK